MPAVNVYYSNRTEGRELIIAVLNTHQHIPIEELHGYIAAMGHPNTQSYIALVDHPDDNKPDDIKAAIGNVLTSNSRKSVFIDKLYESGYTIHNGITYDIYFHKVIQTPTM